MATPTASRPQNRRQNRWLLAGILGILTALGLGTKRYHGPLENWVQHHLGDVLVMIFLIGVARWLWPRRSAGVLSAWVMAIAIAIELLQLWHPPMLQAIRATFLGQIIFGSYFDWWDFVHYGLGALLGYGGLRWLDRWGQEQSQVAPSDRPSIDQ
ncbi:MAG: DUF2809 domain-containing protein [Limnothrix sp. CACIAM 69d]|nr:MAG: DUF2809 domain-containing protein [Limnothrix sp. CACIAM 69d]